MTWGKALIVALAIIGANLIEGFVLSAALAATGVKMTIGVGILMFILALGTNVATIKYLA